MSWYRTYRPQRVDQLHLQAVRSQLTKMLKSGKIPHALLLLGPKGTGKTSSARILAKVVNCDKNQDVKPGKPLHEPCLRCDQCLAIQRGAAVNVVEMDAASNRRIDDIRELRESIYMPPAMGSKSVYIIDEVHMLTTEAFNALLKILEEPPSHALFILATTEAHKLPETVISRCTLISFQTASNEEITDALKVIVEKEKLKVEEQVLQAVASKSQGSFRDAVKLLEQVVESVSPQNEIKYEQVSGLLKTLNQNTVVEFCQSIISKDEQAVAQLFQMIRANSLDVKVFHKQLLEYLHQQLMITLGVELGQAFSSQVAILFLLKQFGQVVIDDRLPIPSLPLEIVALEMILKSKGQQTGSGKSGQQPTKAVSKEPAKVVSKTQPATSVNQGLETTDLNQATQSLVDLAVEDDQIEVVEVTERSTYKLDQVPAISENGSWADGSALEQKWNQLLQHVGKTNISIEALLRSSQFVSGEQGRVVIQVYYQFHKEQLELDRYRSIVESALTELIGGRVRCEYVLANSSQKLTNTPDDNLSGQVTQEAEELIALAEEALL